MMGDIYRSAERVIVWLGDVTVGSLEVMETMVLLEMLKYHIGNYEQYKQNHIDLRSPGLATGTFGG
jgi:hypothetical protein